jgi:hypothetical protein
MSGTLTTGPIQTNPSGGTTGPLADLNQPGYTYNLVSYPQTPDTGVTHQIIFFINIPQESYWNNSSTVSPGAPQPVANRLGAASNFALIDPSTGNPGTQAAQGTYATGLEQKVLQSNTVRTTSAISLYIPPTMFFTQNMQYENVSLSGALGPLADVGSSLSLLESGQYGKAGVALSNLIPDITSEISGSLGIKGSGSLSGARDAALQATGIADNPQNFLLFKQIDFRKFQFDFILVPESQNDTSQINQIIQLFRFHSAPEILIGSTGRFFIPPSQFDIQMMYKGNLNPNIPLINTCICTNVSVNYAAGGKWVTYTDGQPVMIKLSLQFTEIEILTKTLIQAGF